MTARQDFGRDIAVATAADRAADDILTALLRAEWLAQDRPGGEGDDLREDARYDVELLVERYRSGGRGLSYLVDALAERAAEGWLAAARLLDEDPVALLRAADRLRDGD